MDYLIAELGRERQRQLIAEAAEWRRAAAAGPRRTRLRSAASSAAPLASVLMRRATPMRRRRPQPEVSCLRAAAVGGVR